MEDTNRLGNLILTHWRKYQPQLVVDLERRNLLEQSVRQAEIRAADLLFENLAIHKMPFQEAWETAIQECLLPEERKSTSKNLSKDNPATSA